MIENPKVCEKETRTAIVEIGNYAILLESKNFIVCEKNSPTKVIADPTKPFDTNSNTYHISLAQALEQVSKRILEEKMKAKSAEKAMNLKELTDLCREHHDFFVKLSKGIVEKEKTPIIVNETEELFA